MSNHWAVIYLWVLFCNVYFQQLPYCSWVCYYIDGVCNFVLWGVALVLEGECFSFVFDNPAARGFLCLIYLLIAEIRRIFGGHWLRCGEWNTTHTFLLSWCYVLVTGKYISFFITLEDKSNKRLIMFMILFICFSLFLVNIFTQ